MLNCIEPREELYDISNGLNSVQNSEPEIIESHSTILCTNIADLIANTQNVRKVIAANRIRFDYDVSSINPKLNLNNETYAKIIREGVKDIIDESNIEVELNMFIRPKEKYQIELEIKSVKKGKLNFIEPF